MRPPFDSRRPLTPQKVGAALLTIGLLIGAGLVAGDASFDRARERLPITVAAATNEASALVWIAADLGFFEQAGLDVTLNDYAFGRLAAEAMLAGEADMATAAEFVVVRESFERDNLSVIGSMSESRSFSIVARRDRGIASPTDLRGKRVAVAIGTQAEFFLNRFLEFNGLSTRELDVIDLAPTEMVEALVDGGIDAIGILDPHAYEAEMRLGDQAAVFDGLFDDVHHFLLVSTDEWVAANPETTDRFLRGLALAETFNERHPDQAQAVFEARFQRDQAYLACTWQARTFTITMPQNLVRILEHQADWLIDRQLVDHDGLPDYLQVLEPTPLAAVNPMAVSLIH